MTPRLWTILGGATLLALPAATLFAQEQAMIPAEVEETITTYVPPDNGAGPLWCYGAPLMVRHGDEVFISTMETGEGEKPLCNTRWQLWRRGADGFSLLRREVSYDEREPCPLVGFADGTLLLSLNPTLAPPEAYNGPCKPLLLRFAPQRLGDPLRPVWTGEPTFTEHSYRGLAADGPRGEVLLLNIDAQTSEQHWSFLDAGGEWAARGAITFPIRACYPQVALRDRAAHILAIGDIVEPVEEWRTYKHEQTGQDWDYVFRRLLYTWTPDIMREPFSAPVEVANLEATAGHISNLDLWIGPDGAAHLLYLQQSVQSPLMRDRFFPDVPLTTSLEYCVLRDGQVGEARALPAGGEGLAGPVPGWARFHATDDGRLFVVYLCSGTKAEGQGFVENRLLQVLPADEAATSVTIALQDPFRTFFTATERGGSVPSRVLDLYGVGADATVLRYARVRLP